MSTKMKNNRIIIQRKYKDESSIRNYVSGNKILESSIDYIKNILVEEGYKNKKNPFHKEIALNLDKVEILYKKGTYRKKTVDFVVGLDNNSLLLVEAKLNVDNVENISKSIFDKISNSMTILKSNANYVQSESFVIILLKDQNFQQQSNRLRKLLVARNKDIKPSRVCDFYEDYFSSESIPIK